MERVPDEGSGALPQSWSTRLESVEIAGWTWAFFDDLAVMLRGELQPPPERRVTKRSIRPPSDWAG